MYYPEKIEEISYQSEHIAEVLDEIKKNFLHYFNEYIETEKGNTPKEIDISELANKFKITSKPNKKTVNKKENLNRILDEEIESFEKNRHKYLDILDIETLEEYETDTSYFKDTILRNNCPIIQGTLQNKRAKELDKYRYEFNVANPSELLKVITNITLFANEYKRNQKLDIYNIDTIDDTHFSELENDDYIVYGVIGGGIKSQFLYKLYPNIFPYRSREAVWALWFLTSKKSFNCRQDSEFLMINLRDNITQQNFFYPYDLFGFYAIKILSFIKTEIISIGANYNENYRFIILDSFLSFVAQKHNSEISVLKQKVKEDGHY